MQNLCRDSLGALTLSSNVQQDSQGNTTVGGASSSMVNFSVDGISTANVRQNGPLQDAYPSQEGISSVKVTAFNNSAEFSQVGDVTFVTKSGSNQMHGSLFEYLQNDALDASPYGFSGKAPKRFNTFGGSLGGPVVIPHFYNGHNRTFFFFTYEGNRRRTSVNQQFHVPTVAERNGDFSGIPTCDSSGRYVPGPVIAPASYHRRQKRFCSIIPCLMSTDSQTTTTSTSKVLLLPPTARMCVSTRQSIPNNPYMHASAERTLLRTLRIHCFRMTSIAFTIAACSSLTRTRSLHAC